jgi:hypothetical protein
VTDPLPIVAKMHERLLGHGMAADLVCHEATVVLSGLYDALAHLVGCAHEAPAPGLCDQIDNHGQHYPSADLDAGLRAARFALAKARGEQ